MRLNKIFQHNYFQSFLVGLFTLFTLRFSGMIFHPSLGLQKWIAGGFGFHLALSVGAMVIAYFLLEKEVYQKIANKFSYRQEKHRLEWDKISRYLTASLLIGSLFYYLNVRETQTADFRSIKIEFDAPLASLDTLNSPQIWQVYFYTIAGYTAFERQDAQVQGNSVTLPISTEESFTNLRIDPSDEKVAQSFAIKKIDLLKNNEILKTLSGKSLFELMKKNKEVESLTFNEQNQQIEVITSDVGDPFIELFIGDEEFENWQIDLDAKLLAFSALLSILIFLFLVFLPLIITFYEKITTSKQPRFLVNLLLGLAIGVLTFVCLSNREKAVPLKLLTIEFDKQIDIPQDLWKIYLLVDGQYSESFTLMGWSSGRKIFFNLPEGLGFSKMRIDPGITGQEFVLNNITLKSGLETIKKLNGKPLFSSITPLNQITDYGYNAQKEQVNLKTQEGDPFFELQLASSDFMDKSRSFEILFSFLAFIFSLLILSFLPKLQQIDWRGKKASQFFLGINLLLLLGNILFLGDWRYLFLLFNLVWLFLLPGKWLQRKSGFRTGFPLGDNLLAAAMGISVLLFPLYVFYALNIPNAHWIAIFFGICFGLLYLSDEFNNDEKTLFVPKEINLDLLLFNLFFFLFLSPIKDLLCPPLHDPAIIASIANDIADGNFTKENIHISNWTYPPYLQLLTALLGKLSGMITPKVLLFITNLFIFLSGLAFGGMWSRFFKNKYTFWVSTLLFLFISPSIPDLYFTAGKNAMIFSFFYWFILLWTGLILMEKKEAFSPYQGLIYAFLIIAGFQFNYIIIFIFPIIFIYALIWMYKDINLGKQLFIKKYSTLILSGLIPGLIFGLFAFYQYKISLENERFSLFYAEKTINKPGERARIKAAEIEKADSLKQEQEIAINQNDTIIKEGQNNTNSPERDKSSNQKRVESLKKEKKVPSFWKISRQKIISYYNYFTILVNQYSKDYSFFRNEPFSRLIGWFLLLLLAFSKRKKEVLLILALSGIIIYLNQSYIYNLMHYSKILRFVPPLLTGAFLLNLVFHQLRKSEFLSILLLLPIGFISIKQMGRMTENYNQVRSNSVLTKYDLEAFDYIDKNLADKGYFMPANVSNLDKMLPYHGDASVYLGLTKSEAAISFIQGTIIVQGSEEYNNLKKALNQWQNKKTDKDWKLFALMKDYKVKYIYSGVYVPTGRRISVERLENYPYLSRIYENHGVRIYEINYDLVPKRQTSSLPIDG